MSNRILISVGKVNIEAELLDTPTARNVKDALPFGSPAKFWGEEVYCETPVMAELEDNAKDEIKAGEIAFTTENNCIAIAYGKTPASKGDEIRLATKSNIWARAISDVTLLKPCKEGDFIFIEMLQS